MSEDSWKETHKNFIEAGVAASRKNASSRKELSLKKLLEADVSTLKYERLRMRLMYDYDFTCQKCGLKEWNGLPIPLEIEHKDGNHHNNEYSNLTILCPNCHAQTNTYRGRNTKGSKKFPSDEKLLELCKTHDSVRKLLLACGMAGCGSNYERMKNAIKRLGITSVVIH